MTINSRKISPTLSHLLQRPIVGRSVMRLRIDCTRVKIPADYESLGRFIGDDIPEPYVFLPDTNFFTAHEIPETFWNRFLNRRTILTFGVFDELAPWRENPRCNAEIVPLVAQAPTATEPPFLLDADPRDWGAHRILARQYYATLLSSRKARGVTMLDNFIKENGREPSDAEINRMLQCGAEDRDFHIMRKAIRSARNPTNWATDEELAVCAIQIAVVSGSNVAILTRDRDVLDQFEKLSSLLSSHYQAMLFGNRFAREPDAFRRRPMRVGDPVLDIYFDASRSFLVEKPVPADEFTRWLFPREHHPVQVSCILFGGPPEAMTIQEVAFTIEREMDNLMAVKGRTRGRSVELPDGLNCHVTGFPETIENPRDHVILAVDKVLEGPGTDLKWSKIDYAHANYHFELTSILDPD